MIDAQTRPSLHPRGSVGWIKSKVMDLMGSPVSAVSAPGGRDRRSVRVELEDGRTVIATMRELPARGENEAAILRALSTEGAPVPHVVGFDDGLLLQGDAGRNRLSHAVVTADPERREKLIRRAIDGLETCRSAMERRSDLLEKLPGLGTRPGWAEEFVARAVFLSGDLRIAPPDMDAENLALSLAAQPKRLTRWDARLGNAAVQADNSVIWYDWDIFGRRAGVEDISFVVADLYCLLTTDRNEAVLRDCIPDEAKRDLARRMAVMMAVDRLAKVFAVLEKSGWEDARTTLRLDRVGAVPEVIAALCDRMAELAEPDPMVGGFETWFHDARDAFLARA